MDIRSIIHFGCRIVIKVTIFAQLFINFFVFILEVLDINNESSNYERMHDRSRRHYSGS